MVGSQYATSPPRSFAATVRSAGANSVAAGAHCRGGGSGPLSGRLWRNKSGSSVGLTAVRSELDLARPGKRVAGLVVLSVVLWYRRTAVTTH